MKYLIIVLSLLISHVFVSATPREECIELIKELEGLRLEAYKCPSGIWTIGYGHTKNVKPGMVITEEQAIQYLNKDIAIVEKQVRSLVKVKLTEYQFYSLVSFTFNVGKSNLNMLINRTKKSSPAIDRLNQGNYKSIDLVMPKFNKSKGKVLDGLVKRRSRELEMWNKK